MFFRKNNFSLTFSKNKEKSWERNTCDDCRKENRKIYSAKNRHLINKKTNEYRKNNPEKIKISKNNFYKKNRDVILTKAKIYYINNKERKKIYNSEYIKKNKKIISEKYKIYKSKNILKFRNYFKLNYKNNPSIKIRQILSSRIRGFLYSNFSKKNRKSIINYLPYSIQDLKEHLEKQFEPWMSWNNYGRYYVDLWRDDDQSTWTWQIDHIIPHSLFKYSSMEDEEFKQCWSLNNLRPFSSKQNVIDGARHG